MADETRTTTAETPEPTPQTERTFTQDELDRIVEERLARERRKQPQKPADPATDPAPQPTTPDPELATIRDELQIARAQLEAVKAGVRPEFVEDAVYLASRASEKAGKPSDEASMKEALSDVLKRHPDWKAAAGGQQNAGFRVGAGESAPVEPSSYEKQIADARKSGNTAQVIQIKREAAKHGIILN